MENQTLKIPLDPRVFTAATLEVLKSGKFDRRHARNIAGFMSGCTSLLDLDCGIGFVALRARAANPEVQITIHEERPSLLLMSAPHCRGSTSSIRPASPGRRPTLNPDGIWSGLHKLLADTRPDVLRLSGPLLPAEAFTETALTGVRRILIPFLDPSEVTAARTRLAPALTTFGFTEDTNGEPNGTIYLRRE